MNHTRIILAACLTAMVLTFSGCGTSLNWDAVVPAHANSYTYRNTGEVIEFKRYDAVTVTESSAPGLALEAADLLIKQGVKFAATQLRNEEKKYTKQYSGRYRNTFDAQTYQIIMFRLIETKEDSTLPLWSSPGDEVNVDVDTTVSAFRDPAGGYSLMRDKKRLEIASAFVFALTLSQVTVEEKEHFLAALDLQEIYFSKAKPKVVAFNGKNPVHWASNLLFQSGEAVNVDVHAKLRCIGLDGVNSEVLSRHYPVGGREIRLAGSTSQRSDKVGDWFVIPALSSSAYLTLDLEITESDVSNAAKLYGDAAKVVEEDGEDAVTDFINNITGLKIGADKAAGDEDKKKDEGAGGDKKTAGGDKEKDGSSGS